MKRDPAALSRKPYDLVVVGGGIFGVCAAWDATLRGLSVALLEQGDFCCATSANSYKIVHGGIRYLQQGDFPLVRESSHERSALLRTAPHLIHPLPIVIPTYGYGMKGKPILRSGFLLYDMLTLDRNRGIKDPQRRIPRGKFLSRREVLNHFPDLPAEGLTGAAVMCDAQMYNPPRLALSFLRSAVDLGAQVANYVQVRGFTRESSGVNGVDAVDLLSGVRIQIRARMVLNTAGPWASRLLEDAGGLALKKKPSFSRDVGLVIDRPLMNTYGLACSALTKDVEALIDRGGRHLFILPWKDHTLVGVWHKVYTGPPDEFSVSNNELNTFIEEANGAYPGLQLKISDVSTVITGLILFGSGSQDKDKHSFAKRSILVDHAKEHGIEGLITLIGVRATTARSMAEKAVNLILKKLGLPKVPCRTSKTPIFGGRIESIEKLMNEAIDQAPELITPQTIRSLVRNYGSEYKAILKYFEEDPDLGRPVGTSHVIAAEVTHAVREEMAQTLQDVVLRRTDLGTGVDPGEESLSACARTMAGDLGWDPDRIQKEVATAKAFFAHRGSNKNFKVYQP